MENKKSGLSIASLVLGIISIVTCGFGIIPSILGLIFAIISKVKKKAGPSTAGLITSIIGIILGIFSSIFMLAGGITGLTVILGTLSAGKNISTVPEQPGVANVDDYYTPDYGYTPDDGYTIDDGFTPDDYGYNDPVVGNTDYDLTNPGYYNDYVALYAQNDGTVYIEYKKAFESNIEYTGVKTDLLHIYNSINEYRKMDNLQPIPYDIFFELITVAICEPNYYQSTEEEIFNMTEVYSAVVAQAAATTLDICPDAHVLYAVQEEGEIFNVYLDNGMSMRFNIIQDSSFPDYPYYVNYTVNGTQINNRYSADNAMIYLLAIQMASFE